METKSNAKLKALFIIPSITGIILFMIPVKNADGDWTVVVKILADIISGYIGGFLPLRADPHRFRGDVPHCAGKTQIHYE
jgi:nucleoside recognition membrane protein YjiH